MWQAVYGRVGMPKADPNAKLHIHECDIEFAGPNAASLLSLSPVLVTSSETGLVDKCPWIRPNFSSHVLPLLEMRYVLWLAVHSVH